MYDQRPQPPQFPPQYGPQSLQFAPMTVGQILDRTFNLYRRNFVRYVTITALVYIPIALIATIIMSTLLTSFVEWAESAKESQGAGATEEFDFAMFGQLMASVYATLIFLQLGQEFSKAALAKGVSESYMAREARVGDAMRALLRRGVVVFIAFIVVLVVTVVGMMACFVPGVFCWLWFMLTTQVIVVEKRGPFAAMARSKRLVAGNMGKAFGLGLLLWLITMIVGGMFGQLGQAIGQAVLPDGPTEQVVISQLAQALGQILALPIVAIAMILFYYDLRIRKEGFDLEMLAQSLGSEGTPPYGAPPIQQV